MADHSGNERIPGTPRYRVDKELEHGTEPFFPNFLLKEWIVGALFLVAFIVWVVFNPVELTEYAVPPDPNFVPVPDWYFLFLYQLLKYLPGQYVAVGTVAIPGLASAALMLAPWLDRRKARHPFKRPIATSAMVISLLAMTWLTYEAHVQHEDTLAKMPHKAPKQEIKDTAIVDSSDPAAKIFATNCAACHGADLKGQVGPMLLGIGNKYDVAKLETIVKTGFPDKGMPSGVIKDDATAKQLATWLAKQKQK